ncbi:MAG: T9SS type A sorting domain-containing protein [Ignavibacteria bacterium]|nr:T9SS type A sorting domain-containing protein [Ignavibacteria bacterium]
MKSADGGITWTSINSQSGLPLFCISFLDEVTGVCGGYNIILKTTDGGISWNALNAGLLPATQITGIKYTDSNKIYAAGNSQSGDFYYSNDDGDNWQRNSLGLQYLFGGSVDLVRAMGFRDADNGCIVTDLGTILKTSDGGSHWNTDSSQRFSYLKTEIFKDVFYNDIQNGFFSGSGGRVLKLPDCREELITLTGNNKNFYDSFAAENGDVYCTGDSGVILRKKAVSPEWENIFIAKDIILKSITFSDPFTGFVCSNKGRIFRTLDGEDKWIEFFPGIKSIIVNKIFFKDKYNGFITGGIENSGKGIIYNTSDGGINWKLNFQNAGEGIFYDIYFTDYMTGFAVGGNGSIASTIDGGVSWSLNKLTPYDFNSINFNGIGTGIISGENGVIYRTSDGGKSWQFISPAQYKNLNSVLFTDDLNIISAGDNGAMIHSSDAGVSWQKINSITNNNLLSLTSDVNGIYAFGENGSIIYSIKDKNRNTAVTNKNVFDISNISSLTNYPNPFNPVTRISFSIPERGFVNIKIYDILGKEVRTLLNEMRQAGNYHVEFNGGNLAGGIYICRMEFNNTSSIKRLILLK